MKWRVRQFGDKRVVRRFAWLPVVIEGHCIWLERYFTEEEYAWWEMPDDWSSVTVQGWRTLRKWQ